MLCLVPISSINKVSLLCYILFPEDVVPGPPTNLKTRLIQGMVKVTWEPPG